MCEENTAVAGTRLLIALKRCQMATGSLPRSLDELVPKYIDQVPLDDFDGKPLRYLPDRKIIYAVGTDLADDGGDAQKDVIFEIRF